jgi:hypothetical protein
VSTFHDEPEPELESVAALSEALTVGRPFGSSEYIHQQVDAVFCRRLRLVSTVVNSAGNLADLLSEADGPTRRWLLGDPLVRASTQHALTRIRTGISGGLPLSDCDLVFKEAARHIQRGGNRSLMEGAGLSAGTIAAHHLGWLWSNERLDTPLSQLFGALIARYFQDPPCTPEPGDLRMLQDGVALLDRISPVLAQSALSHTQMVVLTPGTGCWRPVASCSVFELPGVVFLARSSLRSPWSVAEHLLHEALHQKLYDIRHTHSVLIRDFEAGSAAGGDDRSARVVSLWNTEDAPGSNRWGLTRSLAAYHVYVHLAVYASLAEATYDATMPKSAPSYEQLGRVGAVTAFRRAVYLGDELLDEYGDDLGPAGISLVGWLRQCQAKTFPIPPRSQLRATLALERYRREMQRIETMLSADDASTRPSPTPDAVSRFMEAELDSTRAFLVQAVDRDAVRWSSADERTPTLVDVLELRRAVIPVLQRVVHEPVGAEHGSACDRVTSMIESRSTALAGLMLVLPHSPSEDPDR